MVVVVVDDEVPKTCVGIVNVFVIVTDAVPVTGVTVLVVTTTVLVIVVKAVGVAAGGVVVVVGDGTPVLIQLHAL